MYSRDSKSTEKDIKDNTWDQSDALHRSGPYDYHNHKPLRKENFHVNISF